MIIATLLQSFQEVNQSQDKIKECDIVLRVKFLTVLFACINYWIRAFIKQNNMNLQVRTLSMQGAGLIGMLPRKQTPLKWNY